MWITFSLLAVHAAGRDLPWSAGAGPASRVPLQRVGVVILRIMFVPIDLLFFGIAVYGGWLLSIRRISRLDLSVLAT